MSSIDSIGVGRGCDSGVGRIVLAAAAVVGCVGGCRCVGGRV